jgi:flagellar biosynthesis protein FlhB
VIVTNPTHFSVAIKYDGEAMNAPTVVAKGADLLAFQIRQIAEKHGVPIVERPPLARALYHGTEVGQEIAPEHYAAVAELLAYVYRHSMDHGRGARGERGGRGAAWRSPQRDPWPGTARSNPPSRAPGASPRGSRG